MTYAGGPRLAPLAERRAALEQRHPTWVPMTLHGALDAAAERWGERPYVITDEQTLTYADVRQWSLRLARGLVGLGVRPGDRVGLDMANYPEFVACKLAISRTGATAVPINFLNRGDELAYVLAQSRTSVLVVMARHRDLDYLAMLDVIAPGWVTDGGGAALPDLRRVVVFENDGGTGRADALTLARLEADAPEDVELPEVDPGSTADILYTSGTTGGPKGVQLTHDMLLRTAYGAAYGRGFEDGRRIHFAMPMYHVFGYVEGMLPALLVGGAIIPHLAFSPEASLDAIERHRATDMLAIPLMTQAVMDAQQERGADLGSLASLLSSGTATPPGLWDRIDAELACDEVTTGYGMSETTASSTVTRPDDGPEKRRTTNGRLRDVGAAGDPELDGRLVVYRAVDPETGHDLGRGMAGELQARGPGVTRGYWEKPEATAAAFTDDGWLRTGDLGLLDEDDYVHLVGRLKDCYRCGGEQVVPSDVEDVLLRHSAVAQALVVPVPDTRMGEVGVAFVVRRPGAELEADEVLTTLTGRLARFKVPKHVLFVDADEIPLTASGRPRKFLLSELALTRLNGAGSPDRPTEPDERFLTMQSTQTPPAGAPPVRDRITRDTEVGFELVGVKKQAHIQLMGSRLWGRFNPNHWDPVYAAETGLPAPIQTGEMTTAYLSEMCVNYLGADYFRDARMVCKYVASTYAGDVVTTHGRVADKTPKGDGFRFTIDIWAENQDGRTTTVGTMEADVDV